MANLGGVYINPFGVPGTYKPPTPAAPAPAAPATATATTTPTLDTSTGAQATLNDYLNQMGLGDFAALAWQTYLTTNGNLNEVVATIRNSDAYKQRFPDITALISKGIVSNEADYMRAVTQFQDLNHTYGIPAGVHDSAEDVAQLLLGGVSASEWEGRLKLAQQASLAGIDPTIRSELQREYGVTGGDLTAYYLNPSIGLGAAQQRYQAALIGSTADLSGYGQVGVEDLNKLAAQGITQDQARSGFSTLAQEQQLFGPLAGTQEGAITQAQQLGSAFNGGEDARLVEQRRLARLAIFQAGGQFATSAQGVTGLGANQA